MSDPRLQLATQLLLESVENKIAWPKVRPAVLALTGGSPVATNRQALIEALSEHDDDAVVRLRRELLSEQMNAARRVHEARSRQWAIDTPTRAHLSHLPLDVETDFADGRAFAELLPSLAAAMGDLRLLAEKPELAAVKPLVDRSLDKTVLAAALPLRQAPWTVARALDQAMRSAGEDFARALAALREYDDQLVETRRAATKAALAAGLVVTSANADEDTLTAWLAAETDDQKKLAALLRWPTAVAADRVAPLVKTKADEERACLLLTIRSGCDFGFDFPRFAGWLTNTAAAASASRARIDADIARAPELVLYAFVASRRAELGALADTLLPLLLAQAKASEAQAFLSRWASALSAEEQAVLRGGAAVLVGATALKMDARPPPVEPPTPPADERPRAEPRPEPIPEPTPPREPGMLGMLWREHLQGFIADNWYLVLGLGLVLVGASLLAYYTWNKHWLIRFTLAPLALAGFTVGIARLGSWLVGKDPKLQGSAALLRGTATALLPLNFMTVALFADDPDVPLKLATVPLFALVYIAFAAINVRRWTSALNPAVAVPFAVTIVGLNALVLLAPLFTIVGSDSIVEPYFLAAGAYMGLAIVALFLRGYVVRRPELLLDNTLVLFVGLSLLFTYVQVQLWVFGYLRVLPEPSLYALLFVIAGYLVLLLEKELTAERAHRKEASFIGFSLLGLGMLLSLGAPYVRVLAFSAAGFVWLKDTWRAERTVVGHWIGLTLVTIGAANVALLAGFPRLLVGPLVITIAVGHWGAAIFARSRDEQNLARAGEGLHATLLFLAAITVMGAQWTWHGGPLWAGAELLAIAGLLFVAAERVHRLAFVYTAAFLVAFALPYFGCVDLDTLELEGNVMPFGLSIAALLWIALVRFTQAPQLVRARSTVLSFYGALAVAAMLVRLTAERDAGSFAVAAELAGPIAMAAIMLFATYFSRSWIPAAMGAFIIVVLVPDLKAALHMGVSTGLGSAVIAVALLLASFYLRRAPFLRELPPGDAWMFGEKFPFARYDHTLFTAPLVLTMAILSLRVDTFSVFKNYDHAGALFVAGLFVTVVGHTLLGVYLGKRRLGRVFVYLAVPVLYMGLSFTNALFADWRPLDVLVATGLFVHAAYFVYSRWLKLDWVSELLSEPMRRLMEHGSVLTTVLAAALIVAGLHPLYTAPLVAFSLYQVVWHGHAKAERRYGWLLFWLVLVGGVAFADPNALEDSRLWLSSLIERLDHAHSFPAALAIAAGVHALLLACEALPAIHGRWSALIGPSHIGATGLAILLSLLAAAAGLDLPLAHPAFVLIGLTFLLTAVVARAEQSVPIALFVYLCFGAVVIAKEPFAEPPPTLAALALLLIGLTWLVRRAPERAVAGGFPLPWLSWRSAAPAHVLVLATCALTEAALIGQFADEGRLPVTSLIAAFALASCVGLVARAWQKPILHYAGWTSLSIANVLVALVYLREPLVARGLGDAHVVAVGLGVTLLVASALSYLAKDPAMTRTAERSSTLLATAIIGLLTVKYLVHPDLGSMSAWRFLVSGIAAYLAALYLRLAAKRNADALWLTALYHFGVTMALWCAALLLPPLRAPGAALIALGVPLVYFYLRAELGKSVVEQHRYADSATAISFVVFAVYTLRFAVQLLLFADAPADSSYYHSNAPAMIVLGFIMFRLHALRQNAWLATYGGLTLMIGSFFLGSWPASFSPFQHMDRAALIGVLLAHFWIAFAAYRSPLRAGLMRLGAIAEDDWRGHARIWSVVLLAAVHVLFALAVIYAQDASPVFAPLLFGLVTVIWHVASGFRSSGVFVLGAVELLLALHADFFVTSGLEKRFVVWSVLLCFVVLLVARRVLEWLFAFTAIGRAAVVLSVVTLGHLLVHHPSSPLGLLLVGALAVLAAFTPFRRGFSSEAPLAEVALVLAVPWLVYFSQARLDTLHELDAPFRPWPLHALAAALLAIAALARFVHDQGKPPAFERLFAATVAFLGDRYRALQIAFAAVALALLLFVRYISWRTPLPVGEVVLACVLYAGIGYGAWAKGRLQRVAVLFLLAEYCLEQIVETVRYEVVLTNAASWTPHYDIVAMLLASLVLAAVKELVDLEREGLLPVVGTLLGLPIAALSWTVWNDLSLDVALFIIGVNSLIFAFMGRNQKESPYNVIAIFGFIAFVLSVFKGKMELSVLPAFVTPIGVGVLVLVHLYERVLERHARANIRLVTLAAMLGSAGYHALLDQRFPVAFHALFIALSVVIMTVGVLMRVKLYVVVGFAAALLDAFTLLVKAVATMDRGPRMTLIGAFVLLTGALLVGGAIYYKAHKDELLERYARFRGRFAGWE